MKKYIYIACVFILFYACSDYLDVQPYGKVIPKSPEEFSALLNDHLDDISRGNVQSIIGGVEKTVAYFERFSDNLDPCLMSLERAQIANTLYVGDQLNNFSSTYKELYKTIRNCNIILEELDEQNESAKESFGLAYAMRGVAYYHLLQQYCEPYDPVKPNQLGVPLVKDFDMEARIDRSDYGEVVLFAEKDLKKSLEYNIKNPDLLFTPNVVQAYLARLYFWTQNWSEAIKYSTEVINQHPLVDRNGFKEMMLATTEKRGNVIFKEGSLYDTSVDKGILDDINEIKYSPIRQNLVSLYTDKEKDIRYTLYFDDKRRSFKRPFSGIRTAEMYLIRAESYYHTNQAGLALADINELRSKRIEPYSALELNKLEAVKPTDLIQVDVKGNKLTPLMNTILQERRRELFMEKDRWFELKRNGRPSFWTSRGISKLVTEPYMYTFPLPLEDVKLTPGMVQNEGYIVVDN